MQVHDVNNSTMLDKYTAHCDSFLPLVTLCVSVGQFELIE